VRRAQPGSEGARREGQQGLSLRPSKGSVGRESKSPKEKMAWAVLTSTVEIMAGLGRGVSERGWGGGW